MDETDARDVLNEWAARHLPRAPRFRYFQKRNGPMFCWTTERFEDHFASMVFIPVGRGSRSDAANEWRIDEETLSAHTLRKDAKARALRLFTEWEATQRETCLSK